MRQLTVNIDRFPIAGTFTIARGSRTEAVVVTATISEAGAVGHGECVPYPRYGETVEGVAEAIEAMRPRIEAGLTREGLQSAMPPGAARNAVDCALWDLDAKRSGIRAHVTAGVDRWPPATTAYTISLATPEVMAEAAAKAADRPILKVKFGGKAAISSVSRRFAAPLRMRPSLPTPMKAGPKRTSPSILPPVPRLVMPSSSSRFRPRTMDFSGR